MIGPPFWHEYNRRQRSNQSVQNVVFMLWGASSTSPRQLSHAGIKVREVSELRDRPLRDES